MQEIFVFGSNMQGMHGKGAAYTALRNHGAIRGIGEGIQGNSYAIPTKSTPWRRRDLEDIYESIDTFIEFVDENPQYRYFITAIGCGLAGYSPPDIAPRFAPLFGRENVIFNDRFIDFYESREEIPIESFLQ